MPLDGNRLPVLTAGGAMVSHPLEVIIMVSTEEVIIFEFPLFDIPGVGIMVPMDEEELTSCGCRWLWLFVEERLIRLLRRLSKVFRFK
jgi:hypothetical protein